MRKKVFQKWTKLKQTPNTHNNLLFDVSTHRNNVYTQKLVVFDFWPNKFKYKEIYDRIILISLNSSSSRCTRRNVLWYRSGRFGRSRASFVSFVLIWVWIYGTKWLKCTKWQFFTIHLVIYIYPTTTTDRTKYAAIKQLVSSCYKTLETVFENIIKAFETNRHRKIFA